MPSKKSFIHVCLLLFLVAWGCRQKDLPVLKVDAVHSQTHRPDKTEAPPYEIGSAAGVILDSAEFQFPAFGKSDARPNVVQIVGGEHAMYAARFDPSSKNELSADTLRPMKSSPEFGGFRAGDEFIIAIGDQLPPPSAGKPAPFRVMWIAMMKVKK